MVHNTHVMATSSQNTNHRQSNSNMETGNHLEALGNHQKANIAGPPNPQTHLLLKEEDVVKLACEFLQNRDMHISQVTLERESGVINGNYSDDLLFLRQLILDGQVFDLLFNIHFELFNILQDSSVIYLLIFSTFDFQWDDILEFIQPLQALPSFDQNRFHYQILKAKLIELVCIKSETPAQQGIILEMYTNNGDNRNST